MIDTNDKATQPLPLDEQPMKRKRGRPSTGKAMTPAEKQRAYRERQKKSRNQNSDQLKTARLEDLWPTAVNLGERCQKAEARVAELEKASEELRKTRGALEALAERQIRLEDELNAHFKRANKAEARVAELEKELASRDRKEQRKKRHQDEPAATLAEDKTYTLQARTGSGKWLNLVVGIYGEEASRQLDRVIDNKLSGGAKNRQYRLVEDGEA
jgi:chromosome segregation ATPase